MWCSRMTSRIVEALTRYPFERPKAELLRHNENTTYQVMDGAEKYVLRIHQPVDGFSFGVFGASAHSTEYLRGEMELLSALQGRSSICVQSPVKNLEGDMVTALGDGTLVTALEWLEGETLENLDVTGEMLVQIGEMVANLHICTRKLDSRIVRYNYDQSMLPLIENSIRSARDEAYIAPESAETIMGAIREIRVRMDEMDAKGRAKGLTHADLSKSNMIYHHGMISPIDFCLCGYGHYMMDIGSLYGHFSDAEQRCAILREYEAQIGSPVDLREVEPYFALQVILFIAGQYRRAREWDWFKSALERWCRDIFLPLQKREPVL